MAVLLAAGILLAIAAVAILHEMNRSPATTTTNLTMQAAQPQWPPVPPEAARGEWQEVEQAERINEQLMRRYRERWLGRPGQPASFTPALPPSTSEDAR